MLNAALVVVAGPALLRVFRRAAPRPCAGDLRAAQVHRWRDRPAARAATTTLVTGPVRSGKSRHAEHLLAHEPSVTYVATGRGQIRLTPSGAARIEDHQVRRPADGAPSRPSTWPA